MSEENEFSMYKNIVNNYFRIETFEKAKEFCARDMVQLNQRYITEAVCRNEVLNRADKLQKENEELKKELETFNGLKNGTTIMFGAKTQYWRKDKIEKYFISKDIIRTKIKELEEELVQNYGTLGESLTTSEIKVLKELLGE